MLAVACTDAYYGSFGHCSQTYEQCTSGPEARVPGYSGAVVCWSSIGARRHAGPPAKSVTEGRFGRAANWFLLLFRVTLLKAAFDDEERGEKRGARRVRVSTWYARTADEELVLVTVTTDPPAPFEES